MEELVIIGGGIAGLSCLNALLDKGVSPLLLEGGAIGTPKMCGEFLAPPAVALLNTWNLGPLQSIRYAHFSSPHRDFKFVFPHPAGAIARSEVELALAQRALKKGGRIQENSLINEINPATKSTPYIFHLKSGEIIQAKTAIFATGKYGQTTAQRAPLPYFGIKIHFKRVVQSSTLLMYSLKDAYLGIVPISAEVSNCACLVKRELIEKHGSCKQFFYELLEKNTALRQTFEKITDSEMTWFESPAPDFQAKEIPAWPRAFWIGDALAGLYPAIGSGFSHGINSALLASEFYLQNKPEAYLKIAKQELKPKLFLGKLMHQILLNPLLTSAAFPFLQFNSWFMKKCLRKLDY